ncbi:MAG: ATP-binding protein [Candidatus Taylorbacteria bacterium]
MITNLYSIPLWITAIFTASLATVTFWGSKKFSTHAFAFSIYMVTIHTAIAAFFLFEKDFNLENFGIRLHFFVSIIVATSIFYFIKSLTEDKRPNNWIATLLIIISVISFFLIFFTDLITTGPVALKGIPAGMTWGWGFGPYSYVFYVCFFIFYAIGAKLLKEAYKTATDPDVKKDIRNMIVGLIVGVLSPVIFNMALPQIGIYDLAWIGPTAAIFWVSLIAYSIIHHHQMSVRVVVTEVLIIGMTIAAFINIFLSEILGVAGRIFIFAAFTVLGTIIIKDALQKAEQQELLKGLNENLTGKVEEQTKEIRASYQVERNARLELEKVDEAKNQFILITQHHLRTPITSIKWQMESILGGTYGVISPELKGAMSDMGESVSQLNHLIDNLLSISSLRSGIETLNKSPIGLKTVVEDIIRELQKNIDRKHITLHLPLSKEVWTAVSVDKDRMREALFVIIENAVRYNIEGGSITIAGRSTENTFELTVENTGAELSSEDKKKIFSELFYRSSQAQTAHPTGMGIGLSMAQAIIEAHKGTISLGSRKEGGGVRVVVTLPY